MDADLVLSSGEDIELYEAVGVILLDDFVGGFRKFTLFLLFRVGGGIHFEDTLLHEIRTDNTFLFGQMTMDDGVVGFIEV